MKHVVINHPLSAPRRASRRLSTGASSLMLALALAAPAQAALVQGDWDPPFGAPFPQLSWGGTVTINVPPACLALSGTVLNSGTACPLMTVVNAEVGFYDLAAPTVLVETLDFDSLVAVDRIFVNAGQVEAFALDATGRVASTSYLGVTVPGGDQAWFSLEIDFVVGEDTVAVLNWFERFGNPSGGRNDPAFPAIVEISTPTAVPVPATLALALAGLALLGGVRHRA